jgi:hypothetical protein
MPKASTVCDNVKNLAKFVKNLAKFPFHRKYYEENMRKPLLRIKVALKG